MANPSSPGYYDINHRSAHDDVIINHQPSEQRGMRGLAVEGHCCCVPYEYNQPYNIIQCQWLINQCTAVRGY